MVGQRGTEGGVCPIGAGGSAKGLRFGEGGIHPKAGEAGVLPGDECAHSYSRLVGVGRRGRSPRDGYSMLPTLWLVLYSKTKMCCTLYLQ